MRKQEAVASRTDLRTEKLLFGLVLAALAVWVLLPAEATAVVMPTPSATTDEVAATGEEHPGQIAFVALKCSLCHEVSNRGVERRSKSEKMHGRDLAGFGEDFDRDFVEAYMRQEESLEGEKHKKPFKGTDEELQAILDWLETL